MSESIVFDSVEKLTNEKYLNLFKAKYKVNGKDREWIYASRKIDQSKEAKNKPDVVIIVPMIRDRKNDSLKLVIQLEYRPVIRNFEICFPAGLIDENESVLDAAKRELFEETGLEIESTPIISPQLFTSSGMCDESVCYVFAYVKGVLSTENNEENEHIILREVDASNGRLVDYINLEVNVNGRKVASKLWPIFVMFDVVNCGL